MILLRGLAGTMTALVALAVCLCSLADAVQAAAGWSSILTPQVFDTLFPNRNHNFYTYASLQKAAALYPAFGATGSLDTRKREVAAFLGHVMQESGSLRYINQFGEPGGYCDSSYKNCPCASGKSYYGRGPLQISWNYNYCQAGKDLNLNLLQNPDQVATNAVTAWKTAFWFWMSQPWAGNNCHVKMTQSSPSFAATIKLINGMECGGGNPDAVDARVQYYKSVCKVLGVSPGSNLYC